MLNIAEYKTPASGAGRESDVEEFWSRPPLSDHQPSAMIPAPPLMAPDLSLVTGKPSKTEVF